MWDLSPKFGRGSNIEFAIRKITVDAGSSKSGRWISRSTDLKLCPPQPGAGFLSCRHLSAALPLLLNHCLPTPSMPFKQLALRWLYSICLGLFGDGHPPWIHLGHSVGQCFPEWLRWKALFPGLLRFSLRTTHLLWCWVHSSSPSRPEFWNLSRL